ncbi:hypothetical protein D9M69_261730 [compost metagenome]
MQALQLAVGEMDQMVEGQALGETPVARAVGRADQAVEALPEVEFLLLRLDLREQALLAGATGIVTLQQRADFALALAQLAEFGVQRRQLLVEFLQIQRALRLGL